MRKFLSKKPWLFCGGIVMFVAPMTVAASCSDETNATYDAQGISILNSLRVEANSTHDHLVWTAVPANTKVAKYLFYSGDPKSEEDVTQLTSGWLEYLPTTTNFEHSKRALWVKVLPITGAKFDRPLINLTTSSGLDKVKAKLDALPDFDLVKPANIKVTISSGSSTIEEPILPVGVAFRYDTEGPKNLTSVEFRKYLDSSKLTKARLETTVTAYLVPTDESLYLVANPKSHAPIFA